MQPCFAPSAAHSLAAQQCLGRSRPQYRYAECIFGTRGCTRDGSPPTCDGHLVGGSKQKGNSHCITDPTLSSAGRMGADCRACWLDDGTPELALCFSPQERQLDGNMQKLSFIRIHCTPFIITRLSSILSDAACLPFANSLSPGTTRLDLPPSGASFPF